MKPILSICIPTFNRANYLKKCLNSVLPYQGNEIEIVISDNCSSDNTYQLVNDIKDTRIKYNRNSSNLGPVANFYKVLKIATGDYLFLLTDDDFLFPDSIEIAIKFIRNNDVDSFRSDLIIYGEKKRYAINRSYLDKTQVIEPENFLDQAKVWQSAHILTACCFKRDKIPQVFLESEEFLWYPSMLLMGLLSTKQGYIAQPLAMHLWENETYWDLDWDAEAELLRNEVVKTLFVMTNYGVEYSKVLAFGNYHAEYLYKMHKFDFKIFPSLLIELLGLDTLNRIAKMYKLPILKRIKLYLFKLSQF